MDDHDFKLYAKPYFRASICSDLFNCFIYCLVVVWLAYLCVAVAGVHIQ